MARLAVLALLVGCGRIDFPARPTPDAAAPSGHDEDGDGIPDALDPCPYIAGDTADADGDGVGDACDPNPLTPTEHWLLFATMQPGDQPFDDPGTLLQEADALHSIGDTAAIITRPLGTVRLEIGFDILALVGTGQHQIAAAIGSPTDTIGYFGELNDSGATKDVSVAQYDSSTGLYTLLDPAALPAMHPGRGSLRLDAITTSAPAYHLATGWVGELYTSNAPTPSYVGGTSIHFAFNGLDLAIRYVALIATN